jgi:hypothetical protein
MKNKELFASWKKTVRKGFSKLIVNTITATEEMIIARTMASIKAGTKKIRTRTGRKVIMIETGMMTEQEASSQ